MLNYEPSDRDIQGGLWAMITLSHKPLADIIFKVVISCEDFCGKLFFFFKSISPLKLNEENKKIRHFSLFFIQHNHRVLQVDHSTHFRTITIFSSKMYLSVLSCTDVYMALMFICYIKYTRPHSSILESFHLQWKFLHLCKEGWLLENLHLLLLVPLSLLLPHFKK